VPQHLKTTCCVVGGGPAGIMLGYLLARAGIQVTVLEKHGDFLRDFRGDTVHPSTLQILYELDLLDEFLRLPHQKVFSARGIYGDFAFEGPDFRHVPAVCKFVALMPQWEFLNFLSRKARQFEGFELRMQHQAIELMQAGDRVLGVIARGPDQTTVEISADLVVGCDGRHSVTRAASGLPLIKAGVPIDVLWFRISRRNADPENVLGNINYGKALILINRGDYYQGGLIVPKGSFDDVKRRGLESFRQGLGELAPFLKDRTGELQNWDHVKLLTVQINRLQRWHRPGLLCIGDAAHAMSPAGGVGINLAIQDSVAAANFLIHPLREGRVPEAVLANIQRRREFPTMVTQAGQVVIHNAFGRLFESTGPVKAPWQLRAAVRIPGIHRALGYAVGMGVRPEHVRPEPAQSTACRVAECLGRAAGKLVAQTTALFRSRLRFEH
jgi:2-polyprenyl-6-methoxyphenol hydroxylase-like FAD-dependent oxidoreductase